MSNFVNNQKWWQRPQPLWLTLLIVFAAIGLWSMTRSVLAGNQQVTQTAVTIISGYELPYQGFLTDTSGSALDGTYTIKTEICDALTGGTCYVPEIYTDVPVSNGVFVLVLGSQTAGRIPASVWDNTPVYLQITVDGETLTPRELIVSPPQRQWRLLGIKTASSSSSASEAVTTGWHVTRGANNQDLLELITVTSGGFVRVEMTTRYETSDLLDNRICGIYIYDQNGQFVDRAILDSIKGVSVSIWGCSGNYTFELPAGTYTFQAATYTPAQTTMTWVGHRQITVSEYR